MRVGAYSLPSLMRLCHRERADLGLLPDGGSFQRVKSRVSTDLVAWRPFKRGAGRGVSFDQIIETCILVVQRRHLSKARTCPTHCPNLN